MSWFQKEFVLEAPSRGCHLVTRAVLDQVPEIRDYRVGTAHIFIQHTSASLTLNENADPDVRVDMESALNALAPEHAAYYTHTLEGADDMPAHVKCSLLGSHLTIPMTDGRLNLGTWQGIYLCEHRDHPSPRTLVVTLQGETV